MKQTLILVLLIAALSILLLPGCSSSKKVGVRPNEHMEIGWTPRTIFQSPSYAAWFDTGYSHYQPEPEVIDRLSAMHDSVRLVVIYGTWCSDSKREMPRFFRIADDSHFPADRISLIAVDRTMEIPAGIKQQYNITNVPTFIVEYRGIELGRIVESPKKSLERDLMEYLEPFFQK